MPRYKITVTAIGEREFDPADFADSDEETPTGEELLECIESAIADEINDFIADAEDFAIKAEPIESPEKDSL